ncbi:dihydrodipicolinate synthase family protein [Afifella pfennigii]|uniref:dihydrodipicolinate synthase family protein n=1 Tax=Afifella pfennigii TaxID=209897 RepID=UPI00047DCE04|nr:dihydrodipicolinate synthase family protein [Afifella pfennigii]
MKDIAESQERLKGLFNIAVTPFADDGTIDFSALEENLGRVIDLGYDGILIGGTYGEFPTMRLEERAELFGRVMELVGDRLPVMLCTADSDPRAVGELTELASSLGGAPMVTAPYVSEVTEDQIVAFFQAMAPRSRTGIVIYNAPGIGITLSPGVLERLAEIDGIVALKQGDLSPTAIDVLASRLNGRLRLFCASDLAFLGPLSAGFDGLSSTNSCAFPELIRAAYAALAADEAARAGELQRLWYPFRAMARRHGQPQSTKAAMNLRGFRGGRVRPPLRDLDAGARQELAPVVAAIAEASAGIGRSNAA